MGNLNFTEDKKYLELDVQLTCVDDEVKQFLECSEHDGQKIIESGIGYSLYVGIN